MTTSLDELTAQLLQESYVDNEVDARLAAIHILLAADAGSRHRADSETGSTANRDTPGG